MENEPEVLPVKETVEETDERLKREEEAIERVAEPTGDEVE